MGNYSSCFFCYCFVRKKTEDSEEEIVKKETFFLPNLLEVFFCSDSLLLSLSLSRLSPPSSNQNEITDRQNISLFFTFFSSPSPPYY